jgi:hypothetical protein
VERAGGSGDALSEEPADRLLGGKCVPAGGGCDEEKVKEGLSMALGAFLQCAEEEWIDVYQLGEERDRYSGRAEGFSTKVVVKSGVQQARSPRLTPEAAWVARVANALRAASKVGAPRARQEALGYLPALAARVPQRVRTLQEEDEVEEAEGSVASCGAVAGRWHGFLLYGAVALWDPFALAHMADLAKRHASELAQRDLAERGKRFDEWVGKQLKGGAAGLHAVTRVPVGWQSSTCSGSSGPAGLGKEIELLEAEWGKHWRIECDHAELQWPSDLGERPPRPSVEDLRRCLRSFKKDTASGFEAIKPRQLLELSSEGLEALIDLLMAVEQMAEWPQLHTKIVFLAKRLGGVRPVAIIHVVARVQARLRKPLADAWERRNDRPYFWASRGKGCERAVRQQAVECE